IIKGAAQRRGKRTGGGVDVPVVSVAVPRKPVSRNRFAAIWSRCCALASRRLVRSISAPHPASSTRYANEVAPPDTTSI
ncbi:hypothetical protein MUX28_14740, partial [Listeria monocytogenes]|uniref:hypothetical protein n=1 Tax=Listeria monocytogenes TaxID=1639 RepID=UPI00200F09F9